MEAKSFVLGSLAGIAGFAVIDRLVETLEEPAAAVGAPVAAAERALPASNSVPKAQLASVPSPTRPLDDDVGAHPAAPVPANTSSRVRDVPADANAPKSEADEYPQGQAEREAESKDLAWSYNMEQALAHYLAGHPLGIHFDVTRIECRTTHCDVHARSPHADAVPLWGQISHDIAKQPWSDFGHRGTASSPADTGHTLGMTLYRVRSRR